MFPPGQFPWLPVGPAGGANQDWLRRLRGTSFLCSRTPVLRALRGQLLWTKMAGSGHPLVWPWGVYKHNRWPQRWQQPGPASRKLPRRKRSSWNKWSWGDSFCAYFSCAHCVFAQANQNLLLITSHLACIWHSSQNCPRILSSVRRKNVLVQCINSRLYGYRMVMSWNNMLHLRGWGHLIIKAYFRYVFATEYTAKSELFGCNLLFMSWL